MPHGCRAWIFPPIDVRVYKVRVAFSPRFSLLFLHYRSQHRPASAFAPARSPSRPQDLELAHRPCPQTKLFCQVTSSPCNTATTAGRRVWSWAPTSTTLAVKSSRCSWSPARSTMHGIPP